MFAQIENLPSLSVLIFSPLAAAAVAMLAYTVMLLWEQRQAHRRAHAAGDGLARSGGPHGGPSAGAEMRAPEPVRIFGLPADKEAHEEPAPT